MWREISKPGQPSTDLRSLSILTIHYRPFCPPRPKSLQLENCRWRLRLLSSTKRAVCPAPYLFSPPVLAVAARPRHEGGDLGNKAKLAPGYRGTRCSRHVLGALGPAFSRSPARCYPHAVQTKGDFLGFPYDADRIKVANLADGTASPCSLPGVARFSMVAGRNRLTLPALFVCGVVVARTAIRSRPYLRLLMGEGERRGQVLTRPDV